MESSDKILKDGPNEICKKIKLCLKNFTKYVLEYFVLFTMYAEDTHHTVLSSFRAIHQENAFSMLRIATEKQYINLFKCNKKAYILLKGQIQKSGNCLFRSLKLDKQPGKLLP